MRVRDELPPTENSAKLLRQRRAALGAQQGDPDTPASSTLFGRRNRLQADLDSALQQDDALRLHQAVPAASPSELSISVHGRSPDEIRHELKEVEAEIDEVQGQIDDIDRQLAKIERKR